MDGKITKFVCPHCNELMDVGMIYFHVREIFNIPLYRCCQCDFSTNFIFHRDHHKSLTGHQLNDINDLDPLVEENINFTVTNFMNSLVNKSGSTRAVGDITKSMEIREIDVSKQPTDSNGNLIKTTNAQRVGDSEQKKKFFSSTIISINNMPSEYEMNNSSSRSKFEILNIYIFFSC